MKLVRIKRHHRQYTPGDITGFDEEHAQKLIDLGIAEEYAVESSDAKGSEKRGPVKAAAARS